MEAAEIVVTPEEQTQAESQDNQLAERELREYLQVLEGGKDRRPTPPKLVLENGRQLELLPSVVQALQFVLHHMRHGNAIGLVPMSKMLTTNQAAEILNVSRPFLVKLLNQGDIKFTMTGTHHRIRMGDLLKYKQRRDQEMLRGLDELAAEALEAGNYFDE